MNTSFKGRAFPLPNVHRHRKGQRNNRRHGGEAEGKRKPLAERVKRRFPGAVGMAGGKVGAPMFMESFSAKGKMQREKTTKGRGKEKRNTIEQKIGRGNLKERRPVHGDGIEKGQSKAEKMRGSVGARQLADKNKGQSLQKGRKRSWFKKVDTNGGPVDGIRNQKEAMSRCETWKREKKKTSAKDARKGSGRSGM